MNDRIRNYEQGVAEIETLNSIRSSLKAPVTEYTPDESQPARDRVFTFSQEEEILSILGDIDTGIKNFVDETTANVATNTANIERNTSNIDYNSNRISNVEKLLQGNLYDYQTDSTVAYTKNVPNGVMPYAGIERLGGKTIAWNQLVVTGNRTTEKNGITYTITSDGTAVINGTSTAIADFVPTVFSAKPTIGHVYWLRGCPADSSASTYYLNTNNGACYADGLRFTADPSTTRVVHIRVERGVTANNATFKVQCTDLTLAFGAGNEPTLEECRTMFPAESYPYNAGELLSAGVTEIAVKEYYTPIRTFSIPTAVQQLDGYGWSAGTVSNVVDFEKKRFQRFVKSIDLGTLNWTKRENDIGGYYFQNTTLYPKAVTDSSSVANIICSKLAAVSFSDVVGGEKDNVIGVGVMGDESDDVPLVVYISDNQEMTPAQFKESLSGVYLYYEGASQSIDISSILTNDNLFDVRDYAGLQSNYINLTFKNINGDNYRIPVPSSITYMVNLQEAINNG